MGNIIRSGLLNYAARGFKLFNMCINLFYSIIIQLLRPITRNILVLRHSLLGSISNAVALIDFISIFKRGITQF